MRVCILYAAMLRIRYLREAAGLSQEKLAYAAGVSVGTVRRAENGGGMSERTLRKLAAGLKVEVGDLFERAAS